MSSWKSAPAWPSLSSAQRLQCHLEGGWSFIVGRRKSQESSGGQKGSNGPAPRAPLPSHITERSPNPSTWLGAGPRPSLHPRALCRPHTWSDERHLYSDPRGLELQPLFTEEEKGRKGLAQSHVVTTVLTLHPVPGLRRFVTPHIAVKPSSGPCAIEVRGYRRVRAAGTGTKPGLRGVVAGRTREGTLEIVVTCDLLCPTQQWKVCVRGSCCLGTGGCAWVTACGGPQEAGCAELGALCELEQVWGSAPRACPLGPHFLPLRTDCGTFTSRRMGRPS